MDVGVAAVSRPKERCGWNRREDPASSYMVVAVTAFAVSFSDEETSSWALEDSASLDVAVDDVDSESFLLLSFVPLPLITSSWFVAAITMASMAASSSIFIAC